MRVKGLLVALCVLSWTAAGWLWTRASRQDEEIRSLQEQLRAARARAVPVPAPVVAPPPTAESRHHTEPPHEDRSAVVGPTVDPEVETLRAKLQDSAGNLAKLQARVSELETEVLNVMNERAHATAAENEARARVDELTHTVDQMSTDRTAADRHLRELEAEMSRLRAQNAAAGQKTAQLGQLANELRDITRRQQSSVNNVLRRYREVTNMFRTLPELNGPEFTRLQTSLSMADEDVRQLNELSARLGRLEKRIP